MIKVEEKKLIEKVVGGDVKSFEQLILKDQDKYFSFAMSITGGNRCIAEDIYQEALIKAFVNIEKFCFKSAFSTWFWKILKNVHFDYLKSENKIGNLSINDLEGFEPAFDEKKELELIKEDRVLLLRKLISFLPVSYSEVITLVDLKEIDHDEAAMILDIDKNLLKVRLHRARTKLQQLIEENSEFFK